MLNLARKNLMIVRSGLIAIFALAGAIFFLDFVSEYYPLKEWLFFRYARVWLFTLVFAFGSLAIGWRLCRTLLPKHLHYSERLSLSAPLGVLVFFFGVFVVGCFNGFGSIFFVGWPLLLAVVGGPSFVVDHCDLQCNGAQPKTWQSLLPRTKLQLLAAAFLALGVLAVYLQVMLPMNLGADSYWYHLPIGENYAAAGGIRRFNEGWYLGAYPQLASILYCWAFLAPGALVDHVLLCVHIEFVLFLATLFSASVFAARILRRDRLPYAAAAVFLFPKLLIYDSNLNGGADHVLAFFCISLAVAMVRFGRHFGKREASVAGLLMGATILTKYQALYAFVPVGLLCLFLMLRYRRLVPAVVWGVVVLVSTSPHWLKNFVFYHDPLYPLLHKHLGSSPFHKGASALLESIYWPQMFSLTGTPLHKLETTLKALVTFSFLPNDWGFHGKRPEFGSLFTLLLPMLLLFRKLGRVWAAVIAIHCGVALWYYVSHQDRHLQLLVPCMASVTAALLALAWEQGLVARGALSVLVGAQVVWGADAYFIPGHVMLGDSPIRALTAYLEAGYKGEYESRYHFGVSVEAMGKRLPPGAKLLQHDYDTHLGLGAQFVVDRPGWQGAIEYLQQTTPKQSASLLQTIGVTHIAWGNNRGGMGPDGIARELVFSRLFYEYVPTPDLVMDWKVGKMLDRPRTASGAEAPTRIAWFTCYPSPANGIYTPQGLAEAHPEYAFPSDLPDVQLRQGVAQATAAAVRTGCPNTGRAESALGSAFVRIQKAADVNLYVRTAWGDFTR